MKYILAIDQGTTSSRALIINHEGKIISSAQKEFPQHFPQPGWVEHDPSDIWSTQQAVIHEALARKSLRLSDIHAIGITNQRETTVVWDRETGEPVYNAIVWQDRRTTTQCQKLKKAGHEALIRKKTGLLLDPYFSATKLQWILHNVEGAHEKAQDGKLAFGTIDTWLIWKLTGGTIHATDVTNASRTMLFNLETLTWDEELLTLFDIPSSLLPTIHDSSEVIGETEDGIPIAGVAGDQQAALVGQRCFEKGLGKITYGTGCFILIHAGHTIPKANPHLLTTVGYKIGDEIAYAIEGSVFVGGAVVQWLRDNLSIISSSKEVEKLASSVDDTGGVYFVPAFTGLGAPHWDPYARGTIVGLSRGSTKAHIARAALEGVVLQVEDILDLVHVPMKTFRVDGGASRSDMMMELQASLHYTTLERPEYLEVTALGAAYLAGLATKYWETKQTLTDLNPIAKTFTPTLPNENVQNMKKNWKKAIECSKVWHHDT